MQEYITTKIYTENQIVVDDMMFFLIQEIDNEIEEHKFDLEDFDGSIRERIEAEIALDVLEEIRDNQIVKIVEFMIDQIDNYDEEEEIEYCNTNNYFYGYKGYMPLNEEGEKE